jgi:hypothetical protein
MGTGGFSLGELQEIQSGTSRERMKTGYLLKYFFLKNKTTSARPEIILHAGIYPRP